MEWNRTEISSNQFYIYTNQGTNEGPIYHGGGLVHNNDIKIRLYSCGHMIKLLFTMVLLFMRMIFSFMTMDVLESYGIKADNSVVRDNSVHALGETDHFELWDRSNVYSNTFMGRYSGEGPFAGDGNINVTNSWRRAV